MKIEPKKILAINFGGIGDEILFLPALRSLKDAYPNTSITLCLEPRSKSVKELCSTIDETIEIDVKGKNKYFELAKLVLAARKGDFDLVVSSGGNKLIGILLFLAGIRERVGYHTGKLSEFLLTKTVKLNKAQYAACMYHDLIKPITNDECTLPKVELKEFQPMDMGEKPILVHPGVSQMSKDKKMVKTFSAEKWAEIVDRLIDNGYNVHLAGGPDDKDCIEQILKTSRSVRSERFTNHFGKTKNLIDLAKLIKSAGLLLCSDSAPMHIGVGLGIKVAAVFGPTDDTLLLPQLQSFVAIKNCVDCRPCLFEKRHSTCESVECLEIETDEVLKSLFKL